MPTIKFEEALEKLEKIVSDLEGGDLTLDQALKKYEDGIALSRGCVKSLHQAEQKIQVLTEKMNSEEDLVDFNEDSTAGAVKKSKKKKLS